MNIKKRIPWQLKLLAKLVIDRVPFVGNAFWTHIKLYSLGAMEQPEYAYKVFRQHYDVVEFPRKTGGFVVLELGPGDSLFTALVAHALGASKVYLIDAGAYARYDSGKYQAMADFIAKQGLAPPRIGGNLEDTLEGCSAKYLTKGLYSLRAIPSQSLDFVFSQNVLEHVRRAEFTQTQQELYRILRPTGVCSHVVDLKDHLGYALNNLRFSKNIWETFASPGFYTNRIRYSEMLAIFESVGFCIEHVQPEFWATLPTPKHVLAEPYRELPDDELRVKGFKIVLRKSSSKNISARVEEATNP